NSGAGNLTQSIFMRNELVDTGQAGEEMYYRNVVIEDNVIVNGHLHGITVGEAAGLTVSGNTLLRNPNAAQGAERNMEVRIPRIQVAGASRDVRVERNIAAALPRPRSGWSIRSNLLVQDISPARPGYYKTVFAGALTGDARQLDNFAFLPGGPADVPGLGAPLLRPGADRARFAP
ncbi:right-handed parallel beta-helix repeat-containing protein, partial [Actibacterium sp. D379-3]